MNKLRVATYNVHACVGTDRKRSEARIAAVIASLSVDIVGLQELDFGRARSGQVDQCRLIAEQLGWHFIFQAAMRKNDEQYGDAIISRYPLRLHRLVELPGNGSWYCRESRVAIWGEAETNLGRVQIINTHFGLGRSERWQQARHLTGAEWAGSAEPDQPLVLMGDFNSLPGGRTHRSLTSDLRDVRSLIAPRPRGRTFPTRLPALAVDHIFVNRALRPVSLRVHRDALSRTASDHYPLVAELVLQPR